MSAFNLRDGVYGDAPFFGVGITVDEFFPEEYEARIVFRKRLGENATVN